jgi:Leucine-rich repeat (LRR) protein
VIKNSSYPNRGCFRFEKFTVVFHRTLLCVNAHPCTINIDRARVDYDLCVKANQSCSSLKIKSNVLRVIPGELQNCYPNIIDLDVTNCQIHTIEGTLKHDNLTTLLLAKNELTRLGERDFTGVNNLILLDLSHNQIMHLLLEVFIDLPKLIHLKINHNFIIAIALYSNEFIACCSSIKNLELRNNSLKDVSNLRNFVGLQTLELSNNPNLQVDTIPLSGLMNITWLLLNNVGLKDSSNLEFLEAAPNLQNLSIERNQFKPLDLARFPKMAKLDYLNINQITFVNYDLLKERLPNLKQIEMTSRAWNCSVFKKISHYFDDNSITWLNKNTTHCKQDQDSNNTLLIQTALATIAILLELVLIFVECKWKYANNGEQRPNQAIPVYMEVDGVL